MRKHVEADTGTQPFALQRELRFEGVSFAYIPNRPVLREFTLAIPQGQLVALVGPSGVGKTTVVDLLLRLLEPQTGCVTADGTDIRNIRLSSWRDNIAYVPQDATLLDTTVRENIRFYSEATDAEIEEAAKAANIHDVITALPESYDTPVGQRGVTLSGGQRQRITLARALARKPDLLILDEATSAIDAESEQLVRASLGKLRGITTVIAITHQLTTVENMDRVVVLADGNVKEDGTPRQLIEHTDSYLARLLALQ